MPHEHRHVSPGDKEDIQAIRNRYVTIGWALFLILLGIIWLFPEIPEGSFFIGVGVILLGLNLVKYLIGKEISQTSIFLGLIALIIGFKRLGQWDVPIFPLLVILLGFFILFTVLVKKKPT